MQLRSDSYLKGTERNVNGTYLVAIDAHDKTALSACPMIVEKRRFANVAHLSDALYDTLPRNNIIYKDKPMRHIRIFQLPLSILTITHVLGFCILLVRNEITKLIANLIQNVNGL